MDIQVVNRGVVSVIRCQGSLDAQTVGQFKKSVTPIMAGDAARLILDGTALTFIDSMGLGVLISMMRRLRERKGELKMAALTPDVQSIFEITRLNRLFDICPTVDVAAQRFAS
ncbi:MAG: STAS domain-containing protein [Deltaproteobacteria bacterium]|nr:STAS domain-containing protein [Deltaproteobacteria bacterium]